MSTLVPHPHQSQRINSAKDLKVYKVSYDLAMKIFEISKHFPLEERRGRQDAG